MQRADIDEVDFAQIQSELSEAQAFPGDVTVVTGRHPRHGSVILVQAGGLCVAVADDVSEIVSRPNPLEGDA